jgi:hypothetical protein
MGTQTDDKVYIFGGEEFSLVRVDNDTYNEFSSRLSHGQSVEDLLSAFEHDGWSFVGLEPNMLKFKRTPRTMDELLRVVHSKFVDVQNTRLNRVVDFRSSRARDSVIALPGHIFGHGQPGADELGMQIMIKYGGPLLEQVMEWTSSRNIAVARKFTMNFSGSMQPNGWVLAGYMYPDANGNVFASEFIAVHPEIGVIAGDCDTIVLLSNDSVRENFFKTFPPARAISPIDLRARLGGYQPMPSEAQQYQPMPSEAQQYQPMPSDVQQYQPVPSEAQQYRPASSEVQEETSEYDFGVGAPTGDLVSRLGITVLPPIDQSMRLEYEEQPVLYDPAVFRSREEVPPPLNRTEPPPAALFSPSARSPPAMTEPESFLFSIRTLYRALYGRGVDTLPYIVSLPESFQVWNGVRAQNRMFDTAVALPGPFFVTPGSVPSSGEMVQFSQIMIDVLNRVNHQTLSTTIGRGARLNARPTARFQAETGWSVAGFLFTGTNGASFVAEFAAVNPDFGVVVGDTTGIIRASSPETFMKFITANPPVELPTRSVS